MNLKKSFVKIDKMWYSFFRVKLPGQGLPGCGNGVVKLFTMNACCTLCETFHNLAARIVWAGWVG